ncbi:hypothetical protein WJX72_007154 [[Myrmecia] bisecta]|uniref:Late embryogenesis abundant protein LEA-2 subgroup domain-containing protein n=1 Tax=[Myrmecia] bisecta TaxID=41462 RepID=A0AAW1PWJ9_9CHLO
MKTSMLSLFSREPIESYTRLSDGGGSPSDPHATSHFSPPFSSEYEQHPPSRWRAVRKWWREKVLGQREPHPPSGYLTLIPLNDARLKPRRTVLLVMALMLFALAAATGVFLLVPRGVSAGEIDIQADHMSWNTSKGTYQLSLVARVPIYNPNYLKAKVTGDLRVFFYDTEAGTKIFKPKVLPPRALPQVIEVVVDASNVPSQYALSIFSQCATFPRRLIFFLKGAITVEYLGQRQTLSPIDTYFMIDCINGATHPKQGLSPLAPAAPRL